MKIFAPSSEGFSDLFWATAWVNARARIARTASKQCLMVNPFLGDELLCLRVIDLANCSFTLAVRQVLEVSIGAGLERLHLDGRTTKESDIPLAYDRVIAEREQGEVNEADGITRNGEERSARPFGLVCGGFVFGAVPLSCEWLVDLSI